MITICFNLFNSEMKLNVWCFRSRFCTVALYWVVDKLGEWDECLMNHAPEPGSSRPVDQHSCVLLLCNGCKLRYNSEARMQWCYVECIIWHSHYRHGCTGWNMEFMQYVRFQREIDTRQSESNIEPVGNNTDKK